MLHYSIKITGKVQGVWFRKHAREKALELEIKGTVQNLEDKSVLIKAHALHENMEKFIAWCKTGPALAEVQNVEVNKINSTPPHSFTIIY